MFGQQEKNYVTAAIYLRVSTQKQVDTGYGLDLQLNSCRMMAQMKNWNVVKVYRDEGISGTLGPSSRPGLKQMLLDSVTGLFEVLIFYNLDRLGRDLGVINKIITDLTNNKIGIVSCKESIDSSTPQGLFVIQLFGGLAQMNRSTGVSTPMSGIKWNRSTIRKILNREDIYNGGLINDNENDIRWPKII